MAEAKAVPAHTEPHLADLVGVRLKLVRERHGLSQRELARRASVTNGTLSNIEQGRVSPSIASLEKILAAIPMSMQEFFSEDLEISPSIFRDEHFVHIHKNDTDYRILPLNDVCDGSAYLAREIYAPGAKITSEWMLRDGVIAGIVVRGQIELMLDGVDYILAEGEGFSFSIHRPHAFRNSSERICEIVCVSFRD